jgi:glucan phosphorylase
MQVTAVAYDNPIPGFGTRNTINLRLWASRPDREFDLEAFNTGDYVQVREAGWSVFGSPASACLALVSHRTHSLGVLA